MPLKPGDRLVKRGVEVIGASPVDGPAPGRQIDELQMGLAQLLGTFPRALAIL